MSLSRQIPQRAPTLCIVTLLAMAGCEQPLDPRDDSHDGGDGAAGAETDASAEASDTDASDDAGSDAAPGDDGGDEPDTGADPDPQLSLCSEVKGEPLPARRAVLSDQDDVEAEECPEFIPVRVTRQRLFDSFESSCGGSSCHVRSFEEGDPLAETPAVFDVDEGNFAARETIGEEALARILSPNPDEVMPPTPAIDGSQRAEDDKYRVLGERLLAWQERGFPDEFTLELPNDAPCTQDREPFEVSAQLSADLTHIGSCLPDPDIRQNTDEMERLDAVFAGATGYDDLPEFLSDTDMVSLDSETLARRGVYSYAPTYTLFSDHAAKMRYVRVPVGETIAYEPQRMDFHIPDNTRFYKTFLKPVYDANGDLGYRKMETRLIVVRQDERQPDGTFRPRALRATYVWDKDETTARRMDDPFENGEPFSDRQCPYVVDERETRDPRDFPIGKDVSERCTYMTQDETEDPNSGSIRHYMVPSSERCDQCHMGSSSRSYVLGFNPWQVDRRPAGQGGVYDADPYPDELNQLERLIAYGVITGIEPGEAKLEDSQGERKPRTEQELRAQAYMIGNCAFCHNENGFPVVENPLLAKFDLYPDTEGGGIFGFPLDMYSPRVRLGPEREVQVPYITPAFGNFPSLAEGADFRINKIALQAKPLQVQELLSDVDGTENTDAPDYFEGHLAGSDVPDAWNPFASVSPDLVYLGPWRSLLWRNVSTPFSYAESGGLFLHMPRNVAGNDCRAHKIMATWMLSIPSTLEDPFADQPYREVLPEEEGYGDALAAGQARAQAYLGSLTGQHCPDDEDVIHADTVNRARVSAPSDQGVINSPRLPGGSHRFESPGTDGVPDHSHWVVVDTTSDPNRWNPRRPNWEAILATGAVAPEGEDQARMLEDLQSVRLTDSLEEFALEPQPLGLWAPQCAQALESCASDDLRCNEMRARFGAAPTVEDLAEAEGRPMSRWTRGLNPDFPPEQAGDDRDAALASKVHYQSRGQAVFQAICQNCHGVNADSKSPLTTTILELTGGETRVANFVDGLFGPRWAPGLFADQEFRVNHGARPQDWQARYLLFMTLGGTLADIPRSVLGIVGSSPFYGGVVDARPDENAAANMLQAAETLCSKLHDVALEIEAKDGAPSIQRASLGNTFAGLGHMELWESICTFENEPLVHKFRIDARGSKLITWSREYRMYRSRKRNGEWVYPPNRAVGNQYGGVDTGIRPGNTLPWCVTRDPSEVREGDLAKIEALFDDMGLPPGDANRPYCPGELFATGAFGQDVHLFPRADVEHINQTVRERWLRKAAFNAGLAAFYYLDRWTKGEIAPAPAFDACGE